MVFMPGYGKFRKVLLDGIYEEFYLITQLKREYELLFSFLRICRTFIKNSLIVFYFYHSVV